MTMLSALETIAVSWLPALIDATIKGMLVLALAAVVTLRMRRTTAAPRHAVRFLAMASLLLMIRAGTGEHGVAEAAEEATGAVQTATNETRGFDQLSVQFGGIWVWWERAHLTVKGDGAVEFSMNKAPDDDSRYTARLRLSPKHLGQLVQLLKETDWLTKTGANEQPGYTDATRIDIKLVRVGKTQEAWCHDSTPEPYLLKRIQRQEFLLNRAVAAGQEERIFAFREIDQGIRSARGEALGIIYCWSSSSLR
jgi:hypothetical protein